MPMHITSTTAPSTTSIMEPSASTVKHNSRSNRRHPRAPTSSITSNICRRTPSTQLNSLLLRPTLLLRPLHCPMYPRPPSTWASTWIRRARTRRDRRSRNRNSSAATWSRPTAVTWNGQQSTISHDWRTPAWKMTPALEPFADTCCLLLLRIVFRVATCPVSSLISP